MIVFIDFWSSLSFSLVVEVSRTNKYLEAFSSMKLLLLFFISSTLLFVKTLQHEFTFASYDKSKSLPKSFKDSSQLLYLVIKNCGLTKIEHEMFSDLRKLRELKITKNNINALNGDEFNQLESLEVLNLKQNGISELPSKEFSNLHSLHHLHLDENHLAFIDKMTFVNNTKLEFLSISCNDISKLHYKVFSTLSNLRAIDLSLNSIKSLQAELFSSNVNLERIDLARNNLQNIEPTIFDALTKLTTADFEGNPCFADVGMIWPTDIQKLNETINSNCLVNDETRVEWLKDEVQELKMEIIELKSQNVTEKEERSSALPETQTSELNILSTTEETVTEKCLSEKDSLELEKKVSSLEEELKEMKSQKIKTNGNKTLNTDDFEDSEGADDESYETKFNKLQQKMNELEENCTISSKK